jgi:NAD(P)-dependent dehydrogenase (short-subunit alcohol dehydrogenase family)
LICWYWRNWRKWLCLPNILNSPFIQAQQANFYRTEICLQIISGRNKETLDAKGSGNKTNRSGVLSLVGDLSVAAVVAFLAGERPSYITGVSLGLDGGWIKAMY